MVYKAYERMEVVHCGTVTYSSLPLRSISPRRSHRLVGKRLAGLRRAHPCP